MIRPPPRSTLFPYTALFRSIPSTFKRPVSSWKALNLRKTLLMASSVRLKPLNCSRLPCVYAQETLTFLLTQKKTSVFPARTRKVNANNSARSEERFSRNAETDLVCRLLLEKKKIITIIHILIDLMLPPVRKVLQATNQRPSPTTRNLSYRLTTTNA